MYLKVNPKQINNKKIFITGGTGTFGSTLVKVLLDNFNPKEIIIFSRDEMKQWFMQEKYMSKYKILSFIIGDIRDEKSIIDASKGSDVIIHAAATKIVPTAEINPEECIKTNVLGSMNVISAAKQNNIKKVIALSTDKASSPINLYGATKLCADKMFVAAGSNKKVNTIFSVVRYGNVMGSRGSLIPFFKSQKKYLPITDQRMTRFMLSIEQAVNFVLFILSEMKGGEIFVRKCPSCKMTDVAKTINPKLKIKIIGIRPGEKIHEQMIGIDESQNTYEFKNYFSILPHSNTKNHNLFNIKYGKRVKNNFIYSSDANKDWLNTKKLINLIESIK